jgi:hypothetical protein
MRALSLNNMKQVLKRSFELNICSFSYHCPVFHYFHFLKPTQQFLMKKLLLALIALLPFASFAQTGKNVRQLFDKKTIGEIRLTLPVKNWSDALDSMRLYGPGLMTGTVTIDGIKYEGAGVRFRGDKSYQLGLKRNPFTIKLDHTTAGQQHQGYATIKLSSALRDPSMVREVLFSEIAGKYMPASQAAYTKLYVNDEYIGVFINMESIDKQFLSNNYGSNTGPFFKAGVDYKQEATAAAECRQNIFGSLEYEDNLECYKGNFELYAQNGWNELQEFTRVLGKEPGKIEKMLDVDQTLWMLALNNVMVNLNSYSGNHSTNYYLYRDGNGRFHPIVWDLNLAFGSYKNTGSGSDLDLKALQNLDPLLHADNPYKPLISQLLSDSYYKKVYLSHIRQILEENFLNGAYEKRAQELQGMIVVPFNDDKYKVYNLDDFQRSLRETVGKRSKIPGLVELMSKRAKFLKSNPELTSLPSAISDITIQSRGKFENKKMNAFRVTAKADRFPKRILVYYRYNDKDAYDVMPMSEESSNDLPTGVKAFSANVDAKSADATLDYYLVVENAGTVSFVPADYAVKPTKVKLSDLNK